MGSRFSFPNIEQNSKNAGDPVIAEAVWQNKMKVFEELAKNHPDQAVHRPCRISAPTWTIDRITSLATGGFPSQDLQDLLAGLRGQDHLFKELEGDKNYFIGDIVWKDLIDTPQVNFKLKKYYNFFMQHSSITTDEKLIDDLVAFIKKTPDFKFLLSHTAELDHHVHVEGLSSPHTAEILTHLDELMHKLIDAIDDDTLLIITSDHGLVENGHGGVTREERDSFIFAYRRNGLFVPGLGETKTPLSEYERRSQELDYFDLTPTISLILGNTPPLNSIGDILPDILPKVASIRPGQDELTRTYYLLRCRLEVLKQKYFLEQYSATGTAAAFAELMKNTEVVLAKVEGFLFGSAESDSFISPQGLSDLLEDSFAVLHSGTKTIEKFKEDAEQRAFVHDYKSSRWVTISLIIMVVGFILYFNMIGNRSVSLVRFDLTYRYLLFDIGAAFLLSHVLEISAISSFLFFTSASTVIFIYLDATFVKARSALIFLYRFWEELRIGILHNFNGVLLSSAMLTLRIMENNNAMMMNVPLQGHFAVKVLVDYGCLTAFQFVQGIFRPKRNLIGDTLRRLGYIAREVLLILALSLADPKFMDSYLIDLGWFFNTFAEFGVVLGTIIPAVILSWCLFSEISKCVSVKSAQLKAGLGVLGLSLILLIWNMPIIETSPFWGREFLPCLMLILTIVQAGIMLRQTAIPLPLRILIVFSPIMLLMGGKFSSYNTLFNLLLVWHSFAGYNSSCLNDISKQHYAQANVLYLTRIVASAAGLRVSINELCLTCGTLFINDYHQMSWLVVWFHTVYPYIFTFLFTEYFMCKRIKNPRALEAARGVFYSGLNVGFIGDVLGGSLLFLNQSTNLMIGLATCTLVYQGQTFLAVSLLKVVFFLFA